MTSIPYSRRNPPTGPRSEDSERLRNRVAMYLSTIDSQCLQAAWKEVAINTGEPKNWAALDAFLRACPWDVFIDCITHITNGLPKSQVVAAYSEDLVYPRQKWLEFVIPAFDQEHVAFKIDTQGRALSVVDAAFSELVDTTLDGLNDPRFANAKSDVQAALKHMKKSEALDEAIDSTFKAAENIYKMSSGAIQLDDSARKYYQTNWAYKLSIPEKHALAKMIVTLSEWVNAAHYYRHADNQPRPTPPSRETAVWMISTSLAHIRWMAHVHIELNNTADPKSRPLGSTGMSRAI